MTQMSAGGGGLFEDSVELQLGVEPRTGANFLQSARTQWDP